MLARPLSLAALFALVGAGQAPLAAQLSPPSTGGIVTLDLLLQQLAENRRVLVVGAHPDDEDTAFLTLAARGYGAEAAYLSLCRGEGGQNLVGEELGVGLGLLRTGELASARSVDGARQFFTRAYDFGFSKSLDETSRFWQPDSILKDVVRVIRRFRPHVVLSVFTGTTKDGHGQHQAAGVVTRDAFDAAGDASRFPELQSEEQLEPWYPLKLYQSAWFDRASTTLELRTGAIESRSGRTYQQIAMASRSSHRSQDMGRVQPIGPATTRLHLLEDRTGAVGENGEGDGLFLGIPADAGWLASFADSLRGEVTATRLSAAALPIAGALTRGDELGLQLDRQRMLAEAMAIAAGFVIDARAESAEMVPGEPVDVVVGLHNGGPFEVTVLDVFVETPDGWQISQLGVDSHQIGSGDLAEHRFVVTADPDASPTQPYYLERELIGGLYDWSQVTATVRGLPLQPPQLQVSLVLSVLGAKFSVEREVTYRSNDQAIGELRLPVRVVPQIDVKLEPGRLIWPSAGNGDQTFVVTLVNNGNGAVSGVVGLEAEGLASPDAVPFTFTNTGESRVVRFRVNKPTGMDRASIQVRAVARTDEGNVFDRGVVTVSYPHIRPSAMVMSAIAQVQIAPVQLPSIRNVGYVRGAADRIPEALAQFGFPMDLLNGEQLARADLSDYDAIVVGSRAYETDTSLVNHNGRLLEYVERGGHLVVLYQQYQFAFGDYAPYDIGISRPHDRITDETVPVVTLEPGHPAFTVPNQIDSEDWDGWPQERGLYFASQWDDHYDSVLSSHDPGEPERLGGLLFTRFGQGIFIYTGMFSMAVMVGPLNDDML